MIARSLISLTWAEIGFMFIVASTAFVGGWVMAAIMVKTLGKPEGFE